MDSSSKYKVKVLEADETVMEKSCCFVIADEDHTLGNALRHVIMKDPNVDLCGYTIPHPADETIHFCIQLKDDCPQEINALTTLNIGLERLQEMCKDIENEFITKFNVFKVKPKEEPVDIKIKEEIQTP